MEINVIYYSSDIETAEASCINFGLLFIPITEMNNAYLTIVNPERMRDIEDALLANGLEPLVIGCWNEDGTQYIWTKPSETHWNYTPSKYAAHLKGEKTEEEAIEIQVNRMAGKPIRILTL